MQIKYVIAFGLLGAIVVALAPGCKTIPKGAVPVRPFDINKYLGKWYEIARYDYRFERNMEKVTAEYSLKEDGNIKVVNGGYDTLKKEWKNATGKAKFRDEKDEGSLKVSFFGPFYAAYNVIAVDPAYKYALVAGKNLKYLWLLSREKTMPASIKEEYLQKAQQLGYDTGALIWVQHD